MPYWFKKTKQKLERSQDRRVKLTEEDKEEIRKLYHQDRLAIRAIARKFSAKCSRRMIYFVLFPEKLKAVNYPGRWKKYYDREKHKESMKKYLQYKNSVLSKDKK